MTYDNPRFENFDIEDSDEDVPIPEPAGPRHIEIDGVRPEDVSLAQARSAAGVRSVEVLDKAIKVGGAAGWYEGDTFHTTSESRYKDLNAVLSGEARENDGIPTANQARRLFGLDFELERRPLYRQKADGTMIPEVGMFAIVNKDTDERVGNKSVGNKFEVLQPSELDLVDLLADSFPGFAIDRGGRMANGTVAWLQTRPLATSKLDELGLSLETRAMVSMGLAGQAKFQFAMDPTIIECQNYYKSLLKSASILLGVKHTASARSKLDMLSQGMSLVGQQHTNSLHTILALGRTVITRKVRDDFLAKLFPVRENGTRHAKTANRLERWEYAERHAPGAMPGTALGLLQGSTYYAQHMEAVKNGRDPMDYAWYGGGFDHQRAAAGWVQGWLTHHVGEKSFEQAVHVIAR